MRYSSLLAGLFPLLALAACGGDQPLTAPTVPDAEPAFAAAAGLRVVNAAADPGDGTCDAAQCTLREAIKDPTTTTIRFAAGLSGPITLASPERGGGALRIERTLGIIGPTAGLVVRRRMADPPFRILRIAPGVSVALTNLTIRNGRTDLLGGGILNYGSLVLANCRVIYNESTQHGGGIDNHGLLTLTNSTVANNTAPLGAGIDNHHNFTVTLTTSRVTRNAGIGIADQGGALTIANSEISYNTGGGISQHRGTSSLDRVRVVGNSTSGPGGGIRLSNTDMTVANSMIARNSAANGGGIFNWLKADLTIINSTVANNRATGDGGGILNEAAPRAGVTVRLTNSTVSGNSAGRFGGGIFNVDVVDAGAQLTLVNSTVAFNAATLWGGGIGQGGAARLTLTNSLAARNSAPAEPDVASTQSPDVSASYSLIGDGTGSQLANVDGNLVGKVSPNTLPIDPLLGPLTSNGGPTPTHALLAGSPAIDAASSEGCPASDQRGVPRPQGAGCDIGSYERRE